MKKMRRLIPAIAMLLVSAVMLSTASFAWFTMNENVKATGMQIQAEASSSLVIGNAPLTSSTGAPTVAFTHTTVNQLVPMTYNAGTNGNIQGAQLTDGNAAVGFVAPQSTSNVNVQTGIYSENVFIPADNYIEEVLYVASAGEAIPSTDLTFELTAPSAPDGNGAYKAYAAAIYVTDANTEAAWPTTGVLADDAEPDAIIFVDQYNGRFTCKVENQAIPSVIGAGENGNPAVGVKIVVRFYVDGALKSSTKIDVDAGYLYSSATTYTAGGNYYKPTFIEATVGTATTAPFGWYTKNADNTYTQVGLGATLQQGTTYYVIQEADTALLPVILPADQQVVGATLPAGLYTRTMGQDKAEFTFVRSSLVPSGGTELVLAISTDSLSN